MTLVDLPHRGCNMEVDISISGADNLAEILPELLSDPLRKFFEGIIPDTQEMVMDKTPVDNGFLSGNILGEIDPSPMPLYGEVSTDVDYAPCVEEDTDPHWTSWTNLNEWAFRHSMNVFAVQYAIAMRGTYGHHMFQIAFDWLVDWKLENALDQLAADIETKFEGGNVK